VLRLVEQRECKVIVISNEDALAKEDKEKLGAAREKVFDLEFLFTPSVADAISAIVTDKRERKRLLPTFEALQVNNLRIIAKAHIAAHIEFGNLLPEEGRDARERILENVIKICAFRWHKGISIDQGMLRSAFWLEMSRDMKSEPDPFSNNPIADLIIKTRFEPCEADATVLDYLRTGRVDKDQLLKAFQVEKSHANERHAVATSDR